MNFTTDIGAFGGIWDRAAMVLADIALKGVVLLLLASLLSLLLRRRSAATRHLNWLMALTALLLLPALSLLVPQWQLAVLPAVPTEVASDAVSPRTPTPPPAMPQAASPRAMPAVAEPQVPSADAHAFSPQPTPAQAPERVASPTTRRPIPSTLYALTIWLAVALIVLAKLPIGLAIVMRLRRRAASLDHEPWTTLSADAARRIHLARPVRLLMGPNSTMPMAVGILRPAILLPREMQDWTDEKRRAVLLHEMAHVRRLDCLTHALARLALALHWFNPLAWYAMRRLEIERELACDDLVLAGGSLPSSYAGHLLDIARSMYAASLTTAAAVPMARGSHLEGRLLAILDTARPRSAATRRMLGLSLFLMAAFIVPLAAIRLGQAHAAADDVYKPIVPESKPTSDITGIVRDDSGQPVAGVTVLALRGWQRSGERRTAQSDATGHFTFADLKPDGDWHFSANDPRYGWEWDHERYRMVPARPEELPVEIALYKARTLRGTVVDDAAKPVAGARVVLVNQTLPGNTEPVSGHIDIDFLVARTDPAGHFTMDRLRPGKAYFMLEHRYYANTSAETELDGKDARLTIEKGLTLRGRVTHNGAAVPGVAVRVGMSEAHRPVVNWRGKTDADGRFEAPRIRSWPADVRSRSASVTVSVKDGAWFSDAYSVYQTGDQEFPFVAMEARPKEPGQTPTVRDIEVGKPADPKLAGAVRGGAVRVTVPGAEDKGDVYVGSATDAAWSSERRRLDHAMATFDGLPPGKYFVSCFDARPRPPKTIELAAGQTLDVSLEPGPCRIKGVVRSGGKPTGGGHVSWFISPRIPGAAFQGGAYVQADGTYTIDGLAEGTYQLSHEAPGKMLHEFMVEVRKELTPFDIDVPTGRIEGTLVGRTPKPRDPENPWGGGIRVLPRGYRLPPNTAVYAEADPDGRFAVGHLAPGRYTLTGYDYTTSVNIDRDGAVVPASLRAPEKTGEIAGTITGRIPAAIRNGPYVIQVTAFPKDEQGYDFTAWTSWTQVKSKAGAYRIRNVPAGTYGVFVFSGRARVPAVWIPAVEVRTGLSRELSIDIPEGRSVSVATQDWRSMDRAAPICSGWRLRLPSGDWLDQEPLTSSPKGGEFALPFGEYTIEADYGDRGLVTQRFTVEKGEGEQKITVSGPKAPLPVPGTH